MTRLGPEPGATASLRAPFSRRRRNPEARMPLRGHLRELRNRLLACLLVICACAVVGWIWYDQIFAALQYPVTRAAASRGSTVALNFAGIATSFDMRVKVSAFVGVVLACPMWLSQIWAFITPGLTRTERRYGLGFLSAAIPLFLVGGAIAWLALPNAVFLLTDFTPVDAVNLIDVQAYFTFVMRIMLAFGLAFLLPVLMVCLTFAGVVRAATWLHGWRWAVFLVFLFAAVATPTPDAISMIVLAIPMCALYFGAVGLCWLRDRRRYGLSRTREGES